MERYTALTPAFSSIFNSDHESNTLKNRSRSKGPEPEGLTVATLCDRTYAFVSLERIGGVMVYNITDPNSVSFVDYKNARSTSSYSGDHGPETMVYIKKSDSPDGHPYIIVANEISGTLSIFRIQDNVPTSTVTATASVCEGESYAFGTTTLTVSGTYTQTLTNSFGCDSIVNLTLTVIAPGTGTCAGTPSTIINKDATALVSVYPNPSNGVFTIQTIAPARIIIYDALARDILNKDIDAGKQIIQLDNMNVGVYYLKVMIDNNQRVFKLVVNR